MWRVPSSESVWKVFSDGYGPTKALHQAIDRKEDLRRDFMCGDAPPLPHCHLARRADAIWAVIGRARPLN